MILKTEIYFNFVRLTPSLQNFKIAAAKLSQSTTPEKKHRINFANKEKPPFTSELKKEAAVEEPPTPSNEIIVSAASSSRSNILSAAGNNKEAEIDIDLEASSNKSEDKEEEELL